MASLRGVGESERREVDTDPLVDLFRREYEPMLRLAFILLGSQDDAEEAVQDAFLVVQSKWPTLLNPGGYLRTTLVNGCHQRVKREQRRPKLEALARDPMPHSSEPEYLMDLLQEIPDRQRTAVVLAYYCNLTSAEIAMAMDCRTGTAKSLVHRGLERLRRALES